MRIAIAFLIGVFIFFYLNLVLNSFNLTNIEFIKR